MNRQDWIDYFEALNGRSPEVDEIKAAAQAGEFVADSYETDDQLASIQRETVVPDSGKEPSQIEGKAISMDRAQSVPQARTNSTSVSHSTEFSRQVSSYWQWFLAILKAPLSKALPYDKKNSYISLGLLSAFASLSVYIPLWKLGKTGSGLFNAFQGFLSTSSTRLNNPVDFTLYLKLLLAFALFFALLIGISTFIRHFVYGERVQAWEKNLDIYGRLLTFNTVLFALVSLLMLLDIYSLAGIVLGVNMVFLLSANTYILASSPDYSGKDRYHKYLIAIVVNTVLLVMGIRIVASFGLESMFNNIFSIFNYIN